MKSFITPLKPYFFILFGNSAGTVLQFLLLPILTRLYTKSDFAMYAIIMSWSMVTYLLSTFRYDTPILQAVNQKEVASLNTFCIVGVISISMFSSLSLYFDFLPIENTDMSLLFAILITCTFAGYTLIEVACKNLIYYERYKQVGIVRSLTTILTALSQICIAYWFISGVGLIAARAIALTLVLLLVFFFLKKIHSINDFLERDIATNLVTYKKYIKFPKFDMPAGILNYISSNLPYLFVPFYYGLVPEMGLYALVSRVFDGPINILRNSVKNVFHKEASKRFQDNLFPMQYLIRMLLLIFAVCLPFAFIIILFGEQVFSLIFSSEWAVAGNLAAFGTLFFITSLARSPVQCAMQLIDKQNIYLTLEVVDLSIKVILTITSILQGFSVLFWIQGFFIIATINNLLNIIFSLYTIKKFNLSHEDVI